MGRKDYLIDTNIAIYYFGLVLSSESIVFLEEIFKRSYYISVINRIETIRIRRHLKIKLPDAIIAATCLINNCCLITNNIKDFSKIEGLQTHKLELV